MTALTLIGSPFHLGVRGVGMGAGPLELLADDALPAALRSAGLDAEVAWLADPGGTNEVARSFDLDRALAGTVAASRDEDRLPAIVSGNCSVCLGAIGGIDTTRTGIVWLDAHADFHTPETTDTGFLDGMGLAIAVGGCWQTMSRSIPGFEPVRDGDVVLIGARDIDPGERARLDESEVAVIAGGGGPGALSRDDVAAAIGALAERVDGVYLHLDLDSIDPGLGEANEYAAPGGLDLDDVGSTVAAVAARTPILAASFTAYNPELDPERRFRATAVEAIATALAVATG